MFVTFSDIDGVEAKKKTNREELLPAIAANYRNLLKQVGEDPNREGLVETPMRAAKAMLYFTKGYQETVHEVVKVIFWEGKQGISRIISIIQTECNN